MLLGLLGGVSHSSLHSLNINSFNVYTLMLYGSFFPLSVILGTLTLRFVRYFSSILYGCRAPDVRSKVIRRTVPASLTTEVGGLSVEGPIAIESSRVICGCELDDGIGAVAADVVVGGSSLDDEKGWATKSAAEIVGADGPDCLVLWSAISDVEVVVG